MMKDGDLWRQFGTIAEAKNPKAIALTKVKGHATREMVTEKTVRAVDRCGNNQSDAVAELGVATEQPHLTKLARFYAEKQKKYNVLMGLVNGFIVAVRKEERRIRQERKKDRDPFEAGKGDQIKIAKNLEYSEKGPGRSCDVSPGPLCPGNDINGTAMLPSPSTDEPIRCNPREIRDDESGGGQNPREIQNIANFISKIQWDPNMQEEGGITWIELYLWYRMHSPHIKYDIIDSTKPLMKEIICSRNMSEK